MNIQSFNYDNISVAFRNDGYLHATQIAKHFGKLPKDYLKTEQTQEYIAALADNCVRRKILTDKNQLVIIKQGGIEQGTWLHPKLAIHFARWLDPKFAVWCDEQIEQIISGSLQSLPHQNTVQTRKGLVAAVKQLAQSRGMDYSDAFRLVHHRFNVENIEQLSFAQIGEATEFVQRATLWGDVLDKQPAQVSDEVLLCVRGVAAHLPYLLAFYRGIEPALLLLNRHLAYLSHDRFQDAYLHSRQLARLLGVPHGNWRDVGLDLNG
ncbi:KilA-N domain-containing protein [Kingella negevensis]|uniref:KilA-N domain-containing protein n=1 Tax=Kingella negevensis TaxID=1522312 RepID=UPI002550A2DB|nr:KilA-N domain-containing protein [Kingella negevensis]MDK4680173.1 KilA-N domain-containing protein [Kingella negevensis]MDK4682107.1 KilA-N domain-containing protein [Kingella negevensis]MDK4690303.1 KilA-N domain-containing protein [Kingella negevensis]MDK4692351.1 KilA-N domain-containing protein [Kingella negevensis]MDK4698653.1 KilA-N domain-containing protein [Kingella negevensis]